jgi:RHS repeat-associated protein
MTLRLILLYCLLMQFLIPTYGYGKGYFTATRLSPTTYGVTPYYYNKDYLGNIREVVDAGGNLQQRTNYYPFGAPYADLNMAVNASLQPYKYNGKELDIMHGLNSYDFGARQYNPITGRWDRREKGNVHYMKTSEDGIDKHSIRDFTQYINSLPEGHYVFKNGQFVKVE